MESGVIPSFLRRGISYQRVRTRRDEIPRQPRNDTMCVGNRVSRRRRRMSSASDVPPLLTRPARHLFLSPHYDDMPLSAGATVRLLADRGLAPETLVVFGSEPDRDRPLSAFAEAMHERWGLDGERGDRQPAGRGSLRRYRAGSANARPAISGCHLPRRLLPVGRRSLRLSGVRGGVPARRDRRIARSRGLT